MLKSCYGCNKELEINNFPKHSGMSDGHLNKCKNCIIEYSKIYHQKNKEKHNEQAKEWRKKNIERDRDNHAAWRANNMDKVRENQKKANTKYNKTSKAMVKRARRNE